ncbi:MAG: hypothetical protein NVSMB9_10810 [Isosphaeraceae bacterium]
MWYSPDIPIGRNNIYDTHGFRQRHHRARIMWKEAPDPETRPALSRGIGFLNLLVGVFLLSCGLGALLLMVPFLLRNNPFQLDPKQTQYVVDIMREQWAEELRADEQSARSPGEKERFRDARRKLLASRSTFAGQVDFDRINADLPWLSRYLWVDLISGPVLNALLIVSGAGLLQRARWGRALAVRVALLKVLRLTVLSAFLAAILVPKLREIVRQFVASDLGEAFLQKALDPSSLAKGPFHVPSIQLTSQEFVQILTTMGYGSALFLFVLGSLYPLIVLVVLVPRWERNPPTRQDFPSSISGKAG